MPRKIKTEQQYVTFAVNLQQFQAGDDVEPQEIARIDAWLCPVDEMITAGSTLNIEGAGEFNVFRIDINGFRYDSLHIASGIIGTFELILFRHAGGKSWYKYKATCTVKES